MDYFTAGLHGDLKLYKQIKKMLDTDDHLWILGDIFDGNTSHPEHCIEILNDIHRSKNITLIMGDHEYYHAMRLLQREEDSDSLWTDYLLAEDISGKPLIEYIDSLPEEDIADIIHKLVGLEVSNILKVGKRLYYCCHGSPVTRMITEGGNMTWQLMVVSSSIDMSSDYSIEMGSDINIEAFTSMYDSLDFKKMIIITGHTSVEEMEDEGIPLLDGLYYENKKFNLNQNHTADDSEENGCLPEWTLLCIDSAGFLTKKI